MADEVNQGTHYYPPGPVAKAFIQSDAFVVGIRGPIGSGKSTAAVMKLIKNAQKQKPLRDGWRRRRTAIIRNTYPELKTTTIKTWHQWLPNTVGHWRDQGPPSHHIIDHAAKIDWEVIFIALDSPQDVSKLLSLELSDAWINEARELPKAILDGLTGRVGRFPPRDGEFGCTNPQILMDTNPPDADHWWYVLAEKDLTTERNRLMHEDMQKVEEGLRNIGALGENQPLFEFFAQPDGESPEAENTKNLPEGYYLKAKAGKDQEWIKVYIRGDYGFVMDGKPVYPEYIDSIHCKPFDLVKHLGIHIGIDFGLTPAAAIGQQMTNGQWRIRSEVVTEDMGIIRFGEVLKQHIIQRYPGYKILSITGDPAGDIRGGDERTPFDLLKTVGLHALPAPGNNDPILRREAVSKPMRSLIDGQPGFLVHPDCNYLRKGLSGGFNYRRVLVTGDAKYRDKPEKNIYSHVCEANEYLFLGAGEGKTIIKREVQPNRVAYAIDDYDILG
jgi:hypothetical protein